MKDKSQGLSYKDAGVDIDAANAALKTVKELVQRWYPESKYVYTKSKQHESLADIRESIAELQHYRRAVFR